MQQVDGRADTPELVRLYEDFDRSYVPGETA